jgi:hypothetical protein
MQSLGGSPAGHGNDDLGVCSSKRNNRLASLDGHAGTARPLSIDTVWADLSVTEVGWSVRERAAQSTLKWQPCIQRAVTYEPVRVPNSLLAGRLAGTGSAAALLPARPSRLNAISRTERPTRPHWARNPAQNKIPRVWPLPFATTVDLARAQPCKCPVRQLPFVSSARWKTLQDSLLMLDPLKRRQAQSRRRGHPRPKGITDLFVP